MDVNDYVHTMNTVHTAYAVMRTQEGVAHWYSWDMHRWERWPEYTADVSKANSVLISSPSAMVIAVDVSYTNARII